MVCAFRFPLALRRRKGSPGVPGQPAPCDVRNRPHQLSQTGNAIPTRLPSRNISQTPRHEPFTHPLYCPPASAPQPSPPANTPDTSPLQPFAHPSLRFARLASPAEESYAPRLVFRPDFHCAHVDAIPVARVEARAITPITSIARSLEVGANTTDRTWEEIEGQDGRRAAQPGHAAAGQQWACDGPAERDAAGHDQGASPADI